MVGQKNKSLVVSAPRNNLGIQIRNAVAALRRNNGLDTRHYVYSGSRISELDQSARFEIFRKSMLDEVAYNREGRIKPCPLYMSSYAMSYRQ